MTVEPVNERWPFQDDQNIVAVHQVKKRAQPRQICDDVELRVAKKRLVCHTPRVSHPHASTANALNRLAAVKRPGNELIPKQQGNSLRDP